MKQFLLYLDESNALGKKFIIQDLDETHVFVLAELVNFLQERVGELMDQNSFPITQKWEKREMRLLQVLEQWISIVWVVTVLIDNTVVCKFYIEVATIENASFS